MTSPISALLMEKLLYTELNHRDTGNTEKDKEFFDRIYRMNRIIFRFFSPGS
jgi:hypothetical protein